jgi:hypothetical protein
MKLFYIWVFFEKLMIPEAVKKFPSFYGTRIFINMFTRVCRLSKSWARSIQSTPFQYFYIANFTVPRILQTELDSVTDFIHFTSVAKNGFNQ